MHAIGGLLKHAPALCAFANPTTNSYKRLVDGLRGPDQDLIQPPQPRRHHPDSRQQPQPQKPADRVSRARQRRQSLSALLRHADGRPRRHPEQDPPRRAARQGHLRPSARGAGQRTHHSTLAGGLARALRADHEFLLRGDVFTPDVIDTWIWYKQTHEIESHPRPAPPLRVRALLRRVSEIAPCLRASAAAQVLARTKRPAQVRRVGWTRRIQASVLRKLDPERLRWDRKLPVPRDARRRGPGSLHRGPACCRRS